MQRFDLVEKLKVAEDQASSLNGELQAFVKQFVEAHRKFKDGQKVEVFDSRGISYGIGFVKYAQCGVMFRWGSVARQYAGREEQWLKDLCDIMYAVVKAKKDGTPSERSLMWDKAREEKREGYYYLTTAE